MEHLNLGMITQIPLDCMHLVDLGVMRKFLLRLINKKICFQEPIGNMQNVSKKLISLRRLIPSEFARKPRSLDDISYWKATEFRQFLLYTGIVVLKDELHEDVFYEFLLLHCSYRMICCPKQCSNNLRTIETLLNLFVENFPIIFGENSLSYNVHNLTHLKETFELIGNPTENSCYPFENYLQSLKKCVKRPSKILEQVFRKVVEEKFCIKEKMKGLNLLENKFYFNNSCLTTKAPDNICYIEPGIPVQVQGFSQENGGTLVGRKFLNIQSFFKEPCDSITLGIFLVDSNISDDIDYFQLSEIECKAVKFPFKKQTVLIPILHACL